MPATCQQINALANSIETQVMGLQTDVTDIKTKLNLLESRLALLENGIEQNQIDLDLIQTDVSQVRSGVESLPESVGNVVEALINGLRDVLIAAINGVVDLIRSIFGIGGNGNLERIVYATFEAVTDIKTQLDGHMIVLQGVYNSLANFRDEVVDKILGIFEFCQAILNICNQIFLKILDIQIPEIDLTPVLDKLNELLGYFPQPTIDLTPLNQKLDRLLSNFPLKLELGLLAVINSKVDKLLGFFPLKLEVAAILLAISNVGRKVDSVEDKVSKILNYFPLKIDLSALNQRLDKIDASIKSLQGLVVAEVQKILTRLSSISAQLAKISSQIAEVFQLLRTKFDELLRKLPTVSSKTVKAKVNCNDPVDVSYNVISIDGKDVNPYLPQIAQANFLATQSCVKQSQEDKQIVVTVPEWWPVRVGADRPQLVLVFKKRLPNGKFADSTYTSVIPHYRFGLSRMESPFIPSYRHGSKQLLWELKDNSKIIFYCSSKEEGQRLVELIRPQINPELISKPPRFPDVDGQFSEFEAIAYQAAWYPNGYKKDSGVAPEWIAYF